MSYLGSLKGSGRVIVDEKDMGEANYDIAVFQPRHIKEAHGTINMKSSLIWAVFNAGKPAKLVLQDGNAITIFVTTANVGEDSAAISVSGPIPGF
jgi:hypothetical protein